MSLTKRKGVAEVKGVKINGRSVCVRLPDPEHPTVASIICNPTQDEVLDAFRSYRDGPCGHTLRASEDCWPYTHDFCALCGGDGEFI